MNPTPGALPPAVLADLIPIDTPAGRVALYRAGPDGAIYLADSFQHRIVRLDPKTHVATLFAGTGKAGFAGDGGPALLRPFRPDGAWLERVPCRPISISCAPSCPISPPTASTSTGA